MSKKELVALLAVKDEQLQSRQEKIMDLSGQLQELKRLYFGRKSERYVGQESGNSNQLSLFVQHPHEATCEQTAKEVVKPYKRYPSEQSHIAKTCVTS